MLTHRNVLIGSVFVSSIIIVGIFHLDLTSWWMLLPVIGYIGFSSYGSANIQAGFYIKTFNKGTTNQKQIALTFDDGPVNPYTSEILDILKDAGISATFFCIGHQIEKHPDIFKRMLREGHSVGNHTYSHSPQMGIFPSSNILKELQETDRLILEYGEKTVNWFRPPFGVTNPMIAHALKMSGHDVIGWSVRSLDTVIRDEKKVVQRIVKQLKPGSVVLLHDRLPEANAILRKLLETLRDMEYEVVELEKLLNSSPYSA